MSQLNATPPTPTTNSAHAGISCHCIFDKCPTSWIIDSGASSHMTKNFSFLESSYSETGNIRVDDGAFAYIHRQGTSFCLPSLTLSDVLHVPSLSANLLFVPRITESLKCLVTFFNSHYFF